MIRSLKKVSYLFCFYKIKYDIRIMETTIKNISVSRTTMYGRFEITGNVNGEWISFITNNSTIYDNRSIDNCDTEEEILAHEEAMAYCSELLLEKYNTIKNRI